MGHVPVVLAGSSEATEVRRELTCGREWGNNLPKGRAPLGGCGPQRGGVPEPPSACSQHSAPLPGETPGRSGLPPGKVDPTGRDWGALGGQWPPGLSEEVPGGTTCGDRTQHLTQASKLPAAQAVVTPPAGPTPADGWDWSGEGRGASCSLCILRVSLG